MSTKFTNPKDRALAEEARLEAEQQQALLARQARGVAVDEVADPLIADAPEAPPVAVTQPAVSLTPEQFSMLLGALGQARDAGVGALGPEAFAEVMRQAREPIPENKVHSGVSFYQPGGHADPNPKFKWPEVWMGTIDAEGKAHATIPVLWDLSTRAEIEAINALRPGEGQVQLTDGTKTPVRVVERRDDTGAVAKLLILFHEGFFKERTRANALGTMTGLCQQLVALTAA